jgi:hypothetical protein
MSVIVGGLSGIVGLLLDVTTDYFTTAPGNTRLVAFLYVWFECEHWRVKEVFSSFCLLS